MMQPRSRYFAFFVLLLVCCAGCATHGDRLVQVREAFYAGDLDRAAQAVDRQLARGGGETDVLKLDRAMVHLAAGQPRQAEQLLREVRDRFDHLEQSDLGESALATVTDDNRLAYAGEDYEEILIRAMLALSDLMDDGDDAAAYALQVDDKQRQIVQAAENEQGDNPKLAYKQVALGPYIHGLMRDQTHADYDGVARSYAKVVSWEPNFRAGATDLQRAKHGRHSDRGNGVLYVFALVGRGPYKQETVETPSSNALLIADRILSVTGEHSLPPTVAPIKVPQVVLSVNRIDRVQVSVDDQPAGATETITDVGRLAVLQYDAVYPQVVARAVVRRIVKKGMITAGKEALNVERGSWVNLAMDVGGVAWEAAESADTRCWGLLPDKIQVLRLELPAGEHRIALQGSDGSTVLGPESVQTVTIADGRNTYLMAHFLDTGPIGTTLVGR